jgi:hypothetical protein
MYLQITNDQTGEVMHKRKLEGHEILDCDAFAARFAADYYGAELSKETGRVFTGSADFTVELAECPGSAVCWNIKSYYLDPETFA